MPLTWSKPNGEWGLVGMDLRDVPRSLYGHICKLHMYEMRAADPYDIDDLRNEIAELQNKLRIDGGEKYA